jgi:biopolymer transport protein ExbD
MLNLRRIDREPRIELIPLVDVIFLLLTFFMYAMLLMIRAEILPVQLQRFAAGEPATGAAQVASLTIDARGGLFLDRQPIALADVREALEARKAEHPDLIVYLAADERGESDRLPGFLALYDELAFAGLDIRLVGLPDEVNPPDTPPPPLSPGP